MTIQGDVSHGGTQLLTFSRRKLLQKAAVTVLGILPKPSQKTVISLPEKYPAPSFCIGDTVASHWPDDAWEEYDEKPVPEIGKIVGICWHPIDSCWMYQINWTGGSAATWMYPCFDEHLTDGNHLERLS
jgi:hypothetical protein